MGDDAWGDFVGVARAMSARSGVEQTLARGVAGAVELIGGCDHAGVSVVRGRHIIETQAATDDVIGRGDALQYELAEGPCLQSIHQQETVASSNLLTEARWPTWSRRAAEELGIRSMLCLQLFVTHDVLGCLNLYSDAVDGFDRDDQHTGLALAAHIAVALSAARNEEHVDSAVASRTVMGQAEGILMERYQLTPEQAFAVLSRVSQQQNRKLRQVAVDLVHNGVMPGSLS